jgi:hypothetical protein
MSNKQVGEIPSVRTSRQLNSQRGRSLCRGAVFPQQTCRKSSHMLGSGRRTEAARFLSWLQFPHERKSHTYIVQRPVRFIIFYPDFWYSTVPCIEELKRCSIFICTQNFQLYRLQFLDHYHWKFTKVSPLFVHAYFYIYKVEKFPTNFRKILCCGNLLNFVYAFQFFRKIDKVWKIEWTNTYISTFMPSVQSNFFSIH